MDQSISGNDPARISETVLNVHIIRRTSDALSWPGRRLSERDQAELQRAERALSNITGLELVRALLEWKRSAGLPFKL